jgi:hypothetical protein
VNEQQAQNNKDETVGAQNSEEPQSEPLTRSQILKPTFACHGGINGITAIAQETTMTLSMIAQR